MQGYWPSPANETLEQKLKNLQDAINLRDDGYVFQTLGSHPDLIIATDSNNETLLMYAIRNGSSDGIRRFLEKETTECSASNSTNSISKFTGL